MANLQLITYRPFFLSVATVDHPCMVINVMLYSFFSGDALHPCQVSWSSPV